MNRSSLDEVYPSAAHGRYVKLAGIISIALVALAASSCAGKPYVVEPKEALVPSDAMRSHPIFVVSHGWHTGLIMPASHLNHIIPELKERFGDAPYYEIGWGDKGFYQAQEITTGLSLQALFWSEGTVMHVVAVPYSVRTYFGNSEVVDSCLTDGQIASLATFVANSFTRDLQGRLVRLQPGIYGNSQFYGGQGRYSLLNTCNKWTARGLQSAAVDISPSTTLTSQGVMDAVREFRHPCTLASSPFE
ncbi:MAG: TIGR02117 family protein [Rhodoferax sp.]|nr:TIGR02117 family protein [Rhodoferax sp.]